MPSLQTLCASKPTEQPEEQVPVAEPVQVEVPEVVAPVVETIENPIAYQGFSEETPAVETVEVAPQPETVSENPFALTETELEIIATILPHTPYGAAQVQTQPTQQVEAVHDDTENLDAVTRAVLGKLASILPQAEAKPETPSGPVFAAKPYDHENVKKTNARMDELMNTLMSGSATTTTEHLSVIENPTELQHAALAQAISILSQVQAPSLSATTEVASETAHARVQEIMSALKPTEHLSVVENPTELHHAALAQATSILSNVQTPSLSVTTEVASETAHAKIQEIMSALKPTEYLSVVENPTELHHAALAQATSILSQVQAPTLSAVKPETGDEITTKAHAKIEEIMSALKPESDSEEAPAEIEKIEAPEKLSAVFSQLVDAIHKDQQEPVEVTPVEVKVPEVAPLPARFGTQIGSKITRKSEEPAVAPVAENKKSDDPRPECLSIVYQSFSVLYMFQADAVAADIKQLESDFKTLEGITNGINNFCVPTINRDETFSGAGDCPNELQTIKDIIAKFKKNGPTDYLNVVDTIQNLWSVHKAFENDCVKNQTQATQEPVVLQAVPLPVAVAPQSDCEVQYSEMAGKLLKLADDSVEEDLSEIFSSMNEMRSIIYKINRYCELQYRIDVFPKGSSEEGTCEQDFVDMRSLFANSSLGEFEDLVELTRSAWKAGLRLLHDC